jgi:arginyl-tRNA synthetase
MSTRKGQTIKLEDVLNEAVKKAMEIVEKSETGKDLSKSEMDEISNKVGIGAVKYFDLSHSPQSDIVFDWDKAFVLEGNSAPYIQYTIARINSVIDKSGGEVEVKESKVATLTPEEHFLMRYLSRFPGVTVDAAKNYSPNLLTNYIFDLAQKFNSFYNSQRIIGSENEKFRLMLTDAVGMVLKSGLELLGIDAPKRM